MHKNATKYNKTLSKWCKNKHGASKIIDTFETYQPPMSTMCARCSVISKSDSNGDIDDEMMMELFIQDEADATSIINNG
jgi:hypothetical protein